MVAEILKLWVFSQSCNFFLVWHLTRQLEKVHQSSQQQFVARQLDDYGESLLPGITGKKLQNERGKNLARTYTHAQCLYIYRYLSFFFSWFSESFLAVLSQTQSIPKQFQIKNIPLRHSSVSLHSWLCSQALRA